MPKRMLIDAMHPEETRVVIADNSQIYEFDFITAAKKQVKGNIYLAKITRVEPSLQAAFVEYGGGKQGFLPFAEIHPDYYQIPMSDRKRLIEEVERENELLEAEDEREAERTTGGDAAHSETPSESGATGDDIAEATFRAADQPMEDSQNRADDSEPGVSGQIEEPLSEALAFPMPQAERVQEDVLTEEVLEPLPEAGSFEAILAATENLPMDASGEEAPEGEAAGALGEEARKPEGENGEQVETVVNEEEEISSRHKRVPFFKRYKIQEVIKRGQVVLVQVIKEERGNKGVSLSTYLSLPGRYCVLMPNSPRDGGVSRKISDNDTRKRLKEVMRELKLARGMSVIIRTAGIDRTRAEIRRDFDYLVKLWNSIRDNTLASTAPALIYEESDVIKRAIRDQYTNDIDEVVVEGDSAFESARDFMKMLLPSHTPRVKHYKDKTPLFYAQGIEDQLLSMHDPVVKLKSGGYIVLSPTEALISIDVNSGRATGERNIEETATKTNLEAANEIARQLRLRDLAGLIVIDFIDMMESRNRRAVERLLKDALKNDRAKIQLGRISPFGLLEMSRQRLRPSISEASMVSCPHCTGRGVVRSNESMSIQAIRSLEKEASTGQWQGLKLLAPESVALHLLNHKRALVSSIEERYNVQISVHIDHSNASANFTIEKVRRNNQQPRERDNRDRNNNRRSPVREVEMDEITPADNEVPAMSPEGNVTEVSEELNERDGRSRSRGGRSRRGRGGRNNYRDRNERDENRDPTTPVAAEGAEAAAQGEFNEEPGADAQAGEEGKTRARRSRGGRGGRGRRRWREGEERPAREGEAAAPSSEAGEYTPRERSESPRLPEFTRQAVVVDMPKPPEPKPQPQAQPIPTTHRADGEPPRKGWWQKIIELE